MAFEKELNAEVFSKPLRKSYAFIDSICILRVWSRLQHTSLCYSAKHPILLPKCSRLTSFIIDFYHKKHLHVGLRTLQFLMSQKFWRLSSKCTFHCAISKYITHWKTKPKPFSPIVGNLPSARVMEGKASLRTDVDYGGLFPITMSRYRRVRTCKAFICLFVCLSTKVLHLELASDQSSATFLAAL